MAQVGWLEMATGRIHGLDISGEIHPGGIAPLYICLGTWEELEPGRWMIKD